MARPVPRLVLRILERLLSPRRFHDVAGDLSERWTTDLDRSRPRAWHNLLRTSCSVLWHTATEPRGSIDAPHPRGTGMFTALRQDLRFAARLAVRQPWLSAAALFTMSLGIAATTAIFAVMHAWMLKPLPYRDPDRLVAVWETIPAASIFENTPAPATLALWRGRARAFEGLAPFTAGDVNLTGVGDPVRLDAALVSRELLPLLGASPALGRNFTADEMVPGGPGVAILTHAAWVSRFGRRASAIGEIVQMSGVATTIVGVLPEDIRIIPFTADVWLPLRLTAAEEASGNRMLWVIGRLAPHASAADASREADTLMREVDPDLGARVVPLREQLLGPLARDVVILFAATVLVLLVACANIASLTLARVTGRRQEMLVRTALGAGRGRIVAQMLTESAALGLAGAAGGVLVSGWLIRAVAALSPDAARMPDIIVTSPAIFGFALASATLTSMLVGIAPAARAAAWQIATAMREGTPSVAGGRQRILRVIVAAEVATALTLLAMAGLVLRSYQKLSTVTLGFATEEVVAFQLPRPAAESDDVTRECYEEVLRRLSETPAVASAGMIQALPLRSSAMGSGFRIEGREGDGSSILSYWRVIGGDYFRTLSIPIVRGRAFDRRDRQGAARVAIVTESFARRAWPGDDPIGKRIGWATLEDPMTVVGVVGDVRLSPSAAPGPHVYMPFQQVPGRPPTELVVRTHAGTAQAIDAVRRIVWSIDPLQPVAGISSMDALLARGLRGRRFHLLMFSIAAGLAVTLALVGIYGVLTYASTQMAPELGVRVALGANRRQVAWQVMRMGLAPVLAGIAIGAVLAWSVASVMRGFLFEVDARDPAAFAGAAVLLALVGSLSCAMPAWLAARRDPVLSMRAR